MCPTGHIRNRTLTLGDIQYMTTLDSALLKLLNQNHPDDAFPNSIEPLARWEYLKKKPFNLSQLELNALQNYKFPAPVVGKSNNYIFASYMNFHSPPI
jgi:hypothetical protein